MKTTLILIIAGALTLTFTKDRFTNAEPFLTVTSGVRNWNESKCGETRKGNYNPSITVQLVEGAEAIPLAGKRIYIAEGGNLLDAATNITRDPAKGQTAYITTGVNGFATVNFSNPPNFDGLSGWLPGKHTFTFSYYPDLNAPPTKQVQYVVTICANCSDCYAQ